MSMVASLVPMVVALVSCEQVVKSHSTLAVVKSEVLHLFVCSSEVAIKMGVVLIKWAWLEKFRALMSQPHHSRSASACVDFMQVLESHKGFLTLQFCLSPYTSQ